MDKVHLSYVVHLSRSFWGGDRNGTVAEKLKLVMSVQRWLTWTSAKSYIGASEAESRSAVAVHSACRSTEAYRILEWARGWSAS